MSAHLSQEFHAFSAAHALAVAASAVGIGAFCVCGARAGRREPWVRNAWLWFMLPWQAWTVAHYMRPESFDPSRSLPLHVCDLAPWIAMIALLTEHRLFRTVLYYWGIGLSTQAFVTPTLTRGPADWEFWLFWVGHAQIVGSAIYDITVLRYRPAWRDWLAASIFSLGYLAFVSMINVPNSAGGWNYGYVGDTLPTRPTLLDSLGPWPLRILWLTSIAIGWFAVITAAWPIGRALIGRFKPDPSRPLYSAEPPRQG